MRAASIVDMLTKAAARTLAAASDTGDGVFTRAELLTMGCTRSQTGTDRR